MPILGVIASGISGHLSSPSDFESIQTITMANSTTTTANFTSIPNTYKSLFLRITMSGSLQGSEGWISFNGDTTGSNYTRQVMYNTGSGAGASFAQTSQSAGRSWLYSPDSTTNYPNTYPVAEIWLTDYAKTNKYKTMVSDNWQTLDSSLGSITHLTGIWASTAAINQITFTMQTGYFGPKTILALYGMK